MLFRSEYLLGAAARARPESNRRTEGAINRVRTISRLAERYGLMMFGRRWTDRVVGVSDFAQMQAPELLVQ